MVRQRYHRWTEQEDSELRIAYQSGELLRSVADRMGKTKNQLIGRAFRLGLVKAEASEEAMAEFNKRMSSLRSELRTEWHKRNPGEGARIMAIARSARYTTLKTPKGYVR